MAQERKILYENQEIKIKEENGVLVYNLSDIAKCCGLVKVKKDKLYVRWTDKGVSEKLNNLYRNVEIKEDLREEISFVLDQIEDTDNRKDIYISSALVFNMISFCFSEKGIRFYNWWQHNIKDNFSFRVIPIRKEIKFLDRLEEALKSFNIKGERQYIVKSDKGTNYRIDFYIPSLNIAIEYDENGHQGYTYEQHEGRQSYIKSKLGCRFIRVTDRNSDEYNIGIIIKVIFNL
nr:MAG TPA: restriction endonuclease [Caudoviricetes sp.]